MLGEAIQHQLAVVRPVVSRHHPGGQVVLTAGREGHHQDVLRLPLLRQSHHDVAQERILPLARPRQHRLLPLVLSVVEDIGLGHVVGRVEVGLHAEQVFGVAQMGAQIGGHRLERLEDAGKRLGQGTHQRVARVG